VDRRVGGRALLEATDDALALPQPPLSTLADEKSLVPKDAVDTWIECEAQQRGQGDSLTA